MIYKRATVFLLFFLCVVGLVSSVQAAGSIAPIVSLLLSSKIPSQVGGAVILDKTPTLSQMVTQDTDKIEISWVPGSDGVTPEEDIQYNIYLSTNQYFTPGPDTLQKTVTGVTHTEITGLEPDTLYYGKVVAIYPSSVSEPSTTLQAKTSKYEIQLDDSTSMVIAEDLGLGHHTTTDGSSYTYTDASPGGTLPPADSILFSENVDGGMTLCSVVDSSREADGTVIVQTSQGSLTDILDQGTIYSSFLLSEESSLGADQAVARAGRADQYSAEQDDPPGIKNCLSSKRPKADGDPLTLTVTAEFEPQLITTAEWGETTAKELDSAEVGVIGSLSFTAQVQYDFTTAGVATKKFTLFKRVWKSNYSVGPVPVYQEITLSMDVEASASAEGAIKAGTQANLTETVEVGARYDGSSWTPYITHGEANSLTASLDVVGSATGSVRLIPKIEVKFYEVSGAVITVEPIIRSNLTLEETTDNASFLAAHQNHLTEMSTFDTALELKSAVEVALESLSSDWDELALTCVLGPDFCTERFEPRTLYSLPELALSTVNSTETRTELRMQITDGTGNPFSQGSINWEVFPSDDASIAPGACTKSGSITNCNAVFSPGVEEEYSIFASGYGRLGEKGRRFKMMTLDGVSAGGGAPGGPEPVAPGGTIITNPIASGGANLMWQRSDNGKGYTRDEAGSYCQNLNQDGYSDWRLPTLDELKSLVVCTNGAPTPLQTYPYPPYVCGDGYSNFYVKPTIDPSFSSQTGSYWTSTAHDSASSWAVWFSTGLSNWYRNTGYSFVRCVRE